MFSNKAQPDAFVICHPEAKPQGLGKPCGSVTGPVDYPVSRSESCSKAGSALAIHIVKIVA